MGTNDDKLNKLRKSSTAPYVKRDKNYYLENMDVEKRLLDKATSIAERMFTAMVRESKVEVKLDADDVAEKVLEQLRPILQSGVRVVQSEGGQEKYRKPDFSFDDEPVVIKTERYQIKGEIGETERSKDSTKAALDALENIRI